MAKRIIEISDEDLNKVVNSHKALFIDVYRLMAKTILGGIVLPDNATNGDVIKAMFPCFSTDIKSHTAWVGYEDMAFRSDWWNAPYKDNQDE